MSNPKIDKAKGRVKEAVGKVTGDKQLETEGKIEQAGATVQEKAAEMTADAAEAVGNAIEGVAKVAANLKDKIAGKA